MGEDVALTREEGREQRTYEQSGREKIVHVYDRACLVPKWRVKGRSVLALSVKLGA